MHKLIYFVCLLILLQKPAKRNRELKKNRTYMLENNEFTKKKNAQYIIYVLAVAALPKNK